MAVTRPLLYVSPSATFIGLALTGVALATAPTWIAPSNLRLIAEIFFIFTMAQMWNLARRIRGPHVIRPSGVCGNWSLFAVCFIQSCRAPDMGVLDTFFPHLRHRGGGNFAIVVPTA